MTKSSSSAQALAPAPDAPASMIFVTDHDSEGVLRQCMSDIGVLNADFQSGNISAAIAQLGKRSSPQLLIVDITGAKDPGAQINQLAEVCEPDTGVIVIGEVNDISLYREFKDAGIVEYFFKPLVRDVVMRACNGILTGTVGQPKARMGKLG